jgi:hypothetical protein
MAEKLNKYFASVFTRDSTGNIPKSEKENVPYHGGGRIKKINAWYLNTLMVYL